MTKQAINLTTVVSGFDSGTSLDPVGVRQNNQGVTLAEANGFVSVDAAAPDSATGLKGDFSFNDADNKIYVCVSPFGSIYPGRVIPALTAPTGATAGAYTGIVPTGGSGTGLVVTIVMANATTVTSITSTTAGSGYKSTDVLTIPAAVVGGTSTTFTASPNVAAIAAEYKSVTLS
jgi:hypothetical protein